MPGKSLQDRWMKLRAMSRHEFSVRSRQELSKRADDLLSRAG